MVRIVLLEDDFVTAEDIREDILSIFPRDSKITLVSTEHEFRELLSRGEFDREPPDVFIIDVMVQWTVPAKPSQMPPQPPDVADEGYYTAGLRCARLLRGRNINSPIILYTLLIKSDFDNFDELELPGLYVVSKDSNASTICDVLQRALKR